MSQAVSRTALSMALFRAIESSKDRQSRIIDDPYAAYSLPPLFWGLALLARVSALRCLIEYAIDRRYPGARSSGVSRTRLIDDWLISALEQGVDQLVILGAGFDSRSLRLRQLSSVPTYELDRESILVARRQVFGRFTSEPPKNRRAVSIDFLQNSISETLLASGFSSAARNLVLWEGVTNYLTRQAVTDVFENFARISAPGTLILFTYVHSAVLDCSFKAAGLDRLNQRLAKWGESWTFGFHPEELPGFLADLGYVLIQDLGADDYRRKYYGSTAKIHSGYEFYRVASAKLLPKETAKDH